MSKPTAERPAPRRSPPGPISEESPAQRRFQLRLPAELHGRVAEAAERYRRSMNAEIVARLEHSLFGIATDAAESKVESAFHPQIEATFRAGLSVEENALIRVFRRLSSSQREALLALLTG